MINNIGKNIGYLVGSVSNYFMPIGEKTDKEINYKMQEIKQQKISNENAAKWEEVKNQAN